jgi:hypothetical protein
MQHFQTNPPAHDLATLRPGPVLEWNGLTEKEYESGERAEQLEGILGRLEDKSKGRKPARRGKKVVQLPSRNSSINVSSRKVVHC